MLGFVKPRCFQSEEISTSLTPDLVNLQVSSSIPTNDRLNPDFRVKA